jgi:hypothetical protein
MGAVWPIEGGALLAAPAGSAAATSLAGSAGAAELSAASTSIGGSGCHALGLESVKGTQQCPWANGLQSRLAHLPYLSQLVMKFWCSL